ncbi:hypothetical protein VPNG_09805 [Cytospora leucostoma]|uniref:non-specific serine/threonine protein kinase n=1 Tax=Cytospora leucostoma TaxID=1230097 RepID=A0A423VGL5_9PEZI|nr:hypothetical protein VPNG_09805 [Cytospora leucostoma]
MKDIIVNQRYRIDRKIGEGGFGLVYSGADIQSEEELAIKLEHIRDGQKALVNEVDVYKALSGGVGIPRVRWYGEECDFYVMIHDILGPSLQDLFDYCERGFSLKTVLLLADQLICRMRYIHSKSIIHRDIKPGNFLMGSGRQGNIVYTIDFGLAKQFTGRMAQQINKYGNHRLRVGGTSRYASLRNHKGNEQSWGDDMESLGYMLIDFARGSLPWQGLNATTDTELDEKIGQVKASLSGEEICAGLPDEFAKYINYTRSLRFGEKPNYTRLRRDFNRLFVRLGLKYDRVFDWTERLFYELQEHRSATRSGKR